MVGYIPLKRSVILSFTPIQYVFGLISIAGIFTPSVIIQFCQAIFIAL